VEEGDRVLLLGRDEDGWIEILVPPMQKGMEERVGKIPAACLQLVWQPDQYEESNSPEVQEGAILHRAKDGPEECPPFAIPWRPPPKLPGEKSGRESKPFQDAPSLSKVEVGIETVSETAGKKPLPRAAWAGQSMKGKKMAFVDERTPHRQVDEGGLQVSGCGPSGEQRDREQRDRERDAVIKMWNRRIGQEHGTRWVAAPAKPARVINGQRKRIEPGLGRTPRERGKLADDGGLEIIGGSRTVIPRGDPSKDRSRGISDRLLNHHIRYGAAGDGERDGGWWVSRFLAAGVASENQGVSGEQAGAEETLEHSPVKSDAATGDSGEQLEQVE